MLCFPLALDFSAHFGHGDSFCFTCCVVCRKRRFVSVLSWSPVSRRVYVIFGFFAPEAIFLIFRTANCLRGQSQKRHREYNRYRGRINLFIIGSLPELKTGVISVVCFLVFFTSFAGPLSSSKAFPLPIFLRIDVLLGSHHRRSDGTTGLWWAGNVGNGEIKARICTIEEPTPSTNVIRCAPVPTCIYR